MLLYKANNLLAKRWIFFLILVVLLTVYGCYLRGYALASQSLWLDEAVSVIHATSILEHGYPLLPNDRISWDSVPYHYMNSLCLYVFRDVHFAGRILSVLAGCGSIPLLFLICRNVSRSGIHGMMAITLMTFCFAEIAWSRQARFYALLQLFMLLGIYCGFKVVDGKSKIYLLVALGVGVLAVLTHRSGYILLLFYALLALTHLSQLWRHFRNSGFRSMILIGMSFLLLIILFVPSHSNLINAARRLFSSSNINYSISYIVYFWQELGLLLPFAIIGMILGSIKWPKKVIPLAVVVVVYFLVIAGGWNYFAFRYAFPLFAPALFFISLLLSPSLFACIPFRAIRITSFIASGVLLAVAIPTANLVFEPQPRYILGYTAPQPEWRDAYQLIAQRELTTHGVTNEFSNLVTVSALPLFHDIYLGRDIGRKHYLPITHTGYPGDIVGTAPYTEASLVASLQDLLSIRGYLMLDDFGLRMLQDKEIQGYLAKRTPNLVVKHEYNVFIWLLGMEQENNRTKKSTLSSEGLPSDER